MGASSEEIYAIVDGCIKKNRKDQQKIYEMFYGKMLAICARYTRDVDEAKDVLQDGFIKIFNNLEKFNKEGSLESWVRRIIVNTAIDYYRKNKNTYNIIDDNYQLADEDSIENEDESPYANFKPEDVVKAIQQLSPAYRTVFNMYALENYSHKEIADELDISVGTSKSNFAKAKKNLKRILEKELTKQHG